METTGHEFHYQSVALDYNTLSWPYLVAPDDGSTVSTLTPTLAWFQTPGANDGYRIGIFEGAPESYSIEGLIFITEISDPEVTLFDIPDGILKGGKTYCWFVQALDEHDQDNGGYANQSMEMWHFSTHGCPGDFDSDDDVDGSDLAVFAAGETTITLEEFATDFGRTDCPVYE